MVWFQKEEKVVPALGTKSHARTPSTFGLRFLQSHCPGELSGFDLPGSPAVGDKVSIFEDIKTHFTIFSQRVVLVFPAQ